jgi:hydrogenase/urease accessory protein HupE
MRTFRSRSESEPLASWRGRFVALALPAVGLLLLLLNVRAFAHPVAQGAMEVVVRRDRVEVRARVSVEQATVEQGFSKEPAAENHDALWKRHGDYFARHLHIEADGTPMRGRLVRIKPPAIITPSERILYELEYVAEKPTRPPSLVTLRQDVLNEFEFVPGNRWEATFVTSLAQDDRVVKSGELFTCNEPLTLECDWTALAAPVAEARINRARMFGQYVHHGVMHILTGFDHLLFMAALVLAAASFLDLVKVVTAFTLAHTVTLTLSVLNLVRLPSHIVEPMIAASIVFVAAQNIFWPAQCRGWTRLAVAFGFGLFHGLGFAGGLLEAMEDLPGVAIATAIVAFSVGVELGHQVVVLPLFFGLKSKRRPASAVRPEWIERYASAVVCFAGIYYLAASLR